MIEGAPVPGLEGEVVRDPARVRWVPGFSAGRRGGRMMEGMDPEGAALGEKLRHLSGVEFERVYLEHCRHIVRGQERTRAITTGVFTRSAVSRPGGAAE